MKHSRWQIMLGAALVGLSAVLYAIHYAAFGDPHHIFIYLLGDIAFVPMEVLLVTLVIHRLLEVRQKQAMLNKLNMVVGAFFSEVGTPLIEALTAFDADRDATRKALHVSGKWGDRDFTAARSRLLDHPHKIDARSGDLAGLKALLSDRRDFLLRLLENPNLLEHESFTGLLWAVFHLTEELGSRPQLDGLPTTDYDHLSGDIRRAYGRILSEWLAYMHHLKRDYPYLFSLAVRTNPFDPETSPLVT